MPDGAKSRTARSPEGRSGAADDARRRLTSSQLVGIVPGPFGVVNHVTWRDRGPRRVIGAGHVGGGERVGVRRPSIGRRGHRGFHDALGLLLVIAHADHRQAGEGAWLSRTACVRSGRSHAGGVRNGLDTCENIRLLARLLPFEVPSAPQPNGFDKREQGAPVRRERVDHPLRQSAR